MKKLRLKLQELLLLRLPNPRKVLLNNQSRLKRILMSNILSMRKKLLRGKPQPTVRREMMKKMMTMKKLKRTITWILMEFKRNKRMLAMSKKMRMIRTSRERLVSKLMVSMMKKVKNTIKMILPSIVISLEKSLQDTSATSEISNMNMVNQLQSRSVSL
jgi:hypothetical protein